MSLFTSVAALGIGLAVVSGSYEAGQSSSEQIANLNRMIAHFRQLEQSREKLAAEMAKLNMTLVTNPPQAPIVLKNDEIRETFISEAILIQTQLDDPDYLAAIKDAEAKAQVYIRNRQEATRDHLEKTKGDIIKFRLARQKLQNRLYVLQSKSTLAGEWKARVETPFSWYEYRWDITASGTDTWKVEQTLLDTDHGFHKASVGKKFHSYTLTKTSEGYDLLGQEVDKNPGNPGSFTQTGKLTLKDDALSGSGEHKGARLTHWLKFTATKSKS